MSKSTITVRMRPDKTLEQKTASGWKMFDVAQSGPGGDVDCPALDPDNMPWTPEQLARQKPLPRTRSLRRRIGITQEEFAARYHIPIGTLRDWEQGRSEPDAPARAYLKVIAADPDGVAETLRTAVRPAAE